MLASVFRLNTNGFEFSRSVTDNSRYWTFTKTASTVVKQNPIQLLKQNQLLCFEYEVCCNEIAAILRTNSQIDNKELENKLKNALALAEILLIIHQDYLDIPREAQKFINEQAVFKNMLTHFGVQFSENKIPTACKDHHVSAQIVEKTASLNVLRLALARSRRFFVSIKGVATSLPSIQNMVANIEKATAPFFAYLSWIFFMPRLASNAFFTAKHTLKNQKMPPGEQSLTWQQRLDLQIRRRWFELGNDIAWFTVGVLNCFVFTGPLLPVGIYITLFLQAFDVFYAGLKAYVEIKRMNSLREQYNSLLEDTSLSQDEESSIRNYLSHLDKKISIEKGKLLTRVVSVSVLMIALCATIPFIAAFPIFPFIGGALAVATTIVSLVIVNHFEKKKPKPAQPFLKEALHNHSLFAKKSPTYDSNDAESDDTLTPTEDNINVSNTR